VVGALNVDLVTTVGRRAAPGETVLGTSFLRRFGGEGADQAVAAARASVTTALISAFGDDEDGDIVGHGRPTGKDALAMAVRRRTAARSVIVTYGAAGSVVVTGSTTTLVPAPPARPVDTTGAGDVFVGTLVSALATGLGARGR
jgi:ribokinase